MTPASFPPLGPAAACFSFLVSSQPGTVKASRRAMSLFARFLFVSSNSFISFAEKASYTPCSEVCLSSVSVSRDFSPLAPLLLAAVAVAVGGVVAAAAGVATAGDGAEVLAKGTYCAVSPVGWGSISLLQYLEGPKEAAGSWVWFGHPPYANGDIAARAWLTYRDCDRQTCDLSCCSRAVYLHA